MFIERVPNRNSPPAVLLRESYRDDHGRSQKRTLANLSKLPGDIIDSLKALLKGGTVIGTGPGGAGSRAFAAAWPRCGGIEDAPQDRPRPADFEHREGCRIAAIL